jgi:hypothetical protein
MSGAAPTCLTQVTAIAEAARGGNRRSLVENRLAAAPPIRRHLYRPSEGYPNQGGRVVREKCDDVRSRVELATNVERD